MPVIDPADVVHALDDVHRRIVAAGGDVDAITVVAVTKTFGLDAARAAVAAGCSVLGENYAQELVDKAFALDDLDVAWHFLGSIQTNKIAALAPITSCFQGLCREKEARAIAKRHPGAAVMVQVDVTGRPERGGVPVDQVEALVACARSLDLDVKGLMTVAPVGEEPARAAFRTVTGLADQLELPERSMGMSDDLEIAVQEGSTMIRVGRSLFGPRERRT